jgi:hypothetical protein
MEQLKHEGRTTGAPVSAFMLLSSPKDVPILVAKLLMLRNAGVTESQIQAIADLAFELFERRTPQDEFHEAVNDLWYTVEGERRWGRMQIRNAPGHGFEVELELPGIVAASLSGFLGDGHNAFWTAFLPPAFYD